MAREEQTVEHVRAAIRSLLKKHARNPFFNMREEDFRSFLMQKLRARIKGSVGIELKRYRASNSLELNKTQQKRATTSRVHAEVRIIEKTTKRKPDKKNRQAYDVVVLKDKQVVLRVKRSGTDVLERLELEDVEVVIEIKVAPSNKEHPKYKKDICKLRNLGDARRILVVIDRSMPLGMPLINKKKPNETWTKCLKKMQRRTTDVEVWFLDEDEKPASMFDLQR